MSHPLDPTLQPETDYTSFINESGEIEIEYGVTDLGGLVTIDLSVTISYNVTSIDKEGVEVEYKFVGSQNYIPSDFEQLVKDYIGNMDFMRGQSICKITKV
jgi:hypothetical protein